MELKTKVILAAIVAALSLGLVRYCDRPVITPTPPGTLAPHEKERVEVRGHTVTRITEKETIKEYAPDGAKISLNKDGTISLDIRKHGFTFQPGLGYITTGDRLKPQLDAKWYFYHRFGVHTGLTFDTGVKKPLNDLGKFVHVSAFGSYALPYLDYKLSVGAGLELFPNKYMGVIRYSF